MEGRVLLVAVSLLAAGLAGCVGSTPGGNASAPMEEDRADGTGPSGPDAPTGTDGSNGTGVHQAATRWVRQAWDGRSSIVVFSDTVAAGAVLTAPGICFSCTGGPIEIPEGSTVPPGTDRLSVALDWETPQTAPGMNVTFGWTPPGGDSRSASRTDPGNLTIPVDPSETDVPLADATAWGFSVDASGDPVGSHQDFEVDVEIRTERDGPVPTIRAPPDPWSGGERIALVDNVTRDNAWMSQDPGGGTGYVCGTGSDPCGMTWSVQEGRIVPPATATVRAVLTWQGPIPGPSRPLLVYAVDGDEQPMPLVEDEEGRRVFEVEVEPGQTDSIFRNRTAWSFEMGFETEDQRGGGASGSVTLSAAALKDETSGSSTY